MKLQSTDIINKTKSKFPDCEIHFMTPENGDAYAFVPADKIDVIAAFLKQSPDLSCDFLMSVSAFDAMKLGETEQHIEVTYHFYSYAHRHTVILKVKTPRAGGVVKTLCGLYGCANFQEREVFDHFGVKFDGHPDLRRILLPDDWVGFPLLKDYVEQEEYNGMATTRPSLL